MISLSVANHTEDLHWSPHGFFVLACRPSNDKTVFFAISWMSRVELENTKLLEGYGWGGGCARTPDALFLFPAK
jgi:hypothetical protein